MEKLRKPEPLTFDIGSLNRYSSPHKDDSVMSILSIDVKGFNFSVFSDLVSTVSFSFLNFSDAAITHLFGSKLGRQS